MKDYSTLENIKQDNVTFGTWIPVNERLPEKDKYTEFYKCLVAVSCTSRHNFCETFTALFDGKHFYSNRFDTAFIPGVKAWMPLPTRYEL